MRQLLQANPARSLAMILLGASVACAQSPATPDLPAATGTSDLTVAVCHKAPGSTTFALMYMTDGEVPPHLAHGDGRVADLVPGQSNARFGPACEAVALAPLTITFDGLTTPDRGPFTSYEASGMTVKATLRSWIVFANYGKPKPAIVFFREGTEGVGEVQITSTNGSFVFNSVDVYSSMTPIPYEIAGHVKGTQAFNVTGTVPNTFGNFAAVSSTQSVAIDVLVIRLTNPLIPAMPPGPGGNPMGLDNITVAR